ncbi:hypothetical protein HAX54_034327 [Datura stramonium]|uniref:Syringolide-induced protein 14-1-1 n=1 Tax=Datura stramonium TaxID=4076 RepID=A0ABS8SE52_DATST|nr:hypothetical protein [Datura stramonium]
MEKEKPAKSKKNIILKFLPKAAAAAASAVTFQNHPFSPGREKRFHHHNHKGFSGPIISIIPAEARSRKSNNETNQEPTSPKVSCIGQIKQRKKQKNKIIKTPVVILEKIPSKKKSSRSNFRNLFQRGRKSDADHDDVSLSSSHDVQNRAPCLSHMKRFASGREGNLSNFDWKNVQITPEDHRKYYSDDDREDYCDEDDEQEEVVIPFSAPILVGRDNRPNFPLEPKKEINLWKRRTMTQPNPLQLKK